jgi:hypothetical protein
MKAKNVKSVLRNKFNHFCKHIRDEAVRAVVQENAIITGGAIASVLLGEDVNDFDIYFRTKDAALTVAKHYVQEFASNPPPRFKRDDRSVEIHVEDLPDRVKIVVKSAGVAGEEGDDGTYQYFEGTDPESGDAADYVARVLQVEQDATDGDDKPKYRPVFLSANAITLSDRVQLVNRFFGEPDEIHKNYDFVHVTNYWSSWDNQLVLRPEAIEALLARDLRYVGSKYPICSLIRTRKFIQRDWKITAGQYLKMAMQVSELDLNDYATLEEQLTGVDTAYFAQVLAALKERDPSRVDAAYLVELIDRIF